MRENRPSGSEGGGPQTNAASLPLSQNLTAMDTATQPEKRSMLTRRFLTLQMTSTLVSS